MKRISYLLQHSRAPVFILALSMVLMSTSLFTGFFGDDYIHYALLNPENRSLKPDDASLFGLFSFVNGDIERNQILRDLGLIPWWTYDGLKYAFWRPLAEASHWLDHLLWPRSAVMMHLHNLGWYLLLCASLLCVYRKISGERYGLFIGAALAFYALDATHGFAVSWISNRNSIIAATLGMSSFLLYLAFRETGQWRNLLASLAFMAASLLSAEAGVSTLAYFGAYALTLDKRGALRGLSAIVPHGLVFLAWWATYKGLGFGAANADAYYVDPTSNPVFYLYKLAERVPVMLASQFGFLPAEIYGFAGKTIPEYVFVCMLIVSVVGLLLWPLILTIPQARFWLLGMLFSLAPIASALPHDRNLIFVGIGASALLALVLVTHQNLPRPTPRTWRYSATAILGLNLFVGSIITPVTAYLPKLWNDQMQLAATKLPPTENIEEMNLLLLGTPLAAALAVTPLNYFNGFPLPQRVWILSTDRDEFTFSWQGDNWLIVDKTTPFISSLEQSLRNLKHYPFSAGDTIPLTGASITVTETTGQGQPTQLMLKIAAEQIVFTKIAAWDGKQYMLHDLPPHGTSLVVKPGT